MGGSLEDSKLVRGIVIDKDMSHPQMEKDLKDVKLCAPAPCHPLPPLHPPARPRCLPPPTTPAATFPPARLPPPSPAHSLYSFNGNATIEAPKQSDTLLRTCFTSLLVFFVLSGQS